MKVMEFSEKTKVDHVVPEWAKYMSEDDFISYMPSYVGGGYLELFEERLFQTIQPTGITPMTYYLFDPKKNGADTNKKYPLLVFIHGATNALDGRKCVGHCGGEMFASPEYQKQMGGGAYIIAPLANEKRNAEGMLTDSWSPEYVPQVKGIIDEVIAGHKDDISCVMVMGGSSGGYMSWRMIEAYPDFFAAALPVSSGELPSNEVLETLEKNNVNILYACGKYDEFGAYSEEFKAREKELASYSNVMCYIPDWVRNGDHGVASLYFGIEMGQHCMITQVQANLMFADGTPYDERLPEGVTGWIRSIIKD